MLRGISTILTSAPPTAVVVGSGASAAVCDFPASTRPGSIVLPIVFSCGAGCEPLGGRSYCCLASAAVGSVAAALRDTKRRLPFRSHHGLVQSRERKFRH